jgi:hypothetical protein
MAVEQDCFNCSGALHENIVHQRWGEVIPQCVELGESLERSGELRAMRKKGAGSAEVIDWLITLVK